MRRSRVLLTLLALVAAVLPLGVPSASALEETALSITASSRFGIYHDRRGPDLGNLDQVTYRGTLTTAGGEPVGGATVVLERRLDSEDAFAAVAQGETDDQGRVRFPTPVAGNARYRLSYTGDGVSYGDATSDNARLKAMRDFNARVVERKSPDRVWLTGNINPGWENRLVVWQRKTCASCAWRKVAQARSGDSGGWRFRGAYPPVGKKWWFRARIKGGGDFIASVSLTLVTKSVRAR